METGFQNKKIAMIIAFRDFRDEEYFIPKQILERAGVQIKTISTSLGQAIGKFGGDTDVDFILDKLQVGEYDAVLFVGGPGAAKHIDDSRFHEVAQEVIRQNILLGAICIAPAILAKAGVLAGKRATVWADSMDKSAVKILKEEGVRYQPDSVVIDGKIITANGPAVAKEFAEKIIELLTGL